MQAKAGIEDIEFGTKDSAKRAQHAKEPVIQHAENTKRMNETSARGKECSTTVRRQKSSNEQKKRKGQNAGAKNLTVGGQKSNAMSKMETSEFQKWKGHTFRAEIAQTDSAW